MEKLGLEEILSILLFTFGDPVLMNDLIEQSWATSTKSKQKLFRQGFPPPKRPETGSSFVSLIPPHGIVTALIAAVPPVADEVSALF